jgi:hypothetical protein
MDLIGADFHALFFEGTMVEPIPKIRIVSVLSAIDQLIVLLLMSSQFIQMKGAEPNLSATTFQIHDESHTIGNALRWMLMKKCA